MKEHIEKEIQTNKSTTPIQEELFNSLTIPESFSDFLNRLKKYIKNLNCQNTKDCLESIVSIFSNVKIPSYSNIIQKIENFDNKNGNIFEIIKSKEIENFEGEVVSISFDAIGSTSLDSSALKEFMEQIIYTINIFENLYKDEGLQMFSINGDEIHIGFFSNKLTQKEKVEIFQLLSMILHLITGKEFHHVMLAWEKEKGEGITAVFQENIANTIVSESYSQKYKDSKQSKLPNYVQTDLLEQTKQIPQLKGGLNIKPYLKIDFRKLEENISYLEENNIPLHRLLSKIIINYISNNLQDNNSELLKNKDIEVVNFQKGEKIISYGEKNSSLYLVLGGDLEMQIFGNPNLAKYSSGKTILGEMSMYGRPANANVIATSQVKALKINKKFIEDILSGNIIIDARFTKQLDILLKKYIKGRENYNLLLNQYFQELINYGNKPLNEIFETWNLFLEILLKSEKTYKKAENKPLTYKGKENNKLYFLKKGTIVRKNGIKFTLESDELIGENTFLQYISGNTKPKANASIEIVNGEILEMDFEEVRKILEKNKLDTSKFQEILEKITKLRENSNDFIGFGGEKTFSGTSPFKKAA